MDNLARWGNAQNRSLQYNTLHKTEEHDIRTNK